MKRGCPIVLLLLCALAVPQTVAAAPAKICIAAYKSEGLDAKSSLAFRDRLVAALEEQGAVIAPLPPGRQGGRFEDKVCEQQARAELQAQGVLRVQLFRLGPTVRIKLVAVDAESGDTLVERTSTASTKGFPGSAALDQDLAVLLQKLGHGPAAADEPTEEVPTGDTGASPPPPPPPPPDQTSAQQQVELAGTEGDRAADAGPGVGLGTVLGWGGIGLGAALLAAGAVTGGLSLALDQDLKEVCDGNGVCPTERQGDIDTLSTLTWTTNGLLAGGLVLGLTSAAALLLIGGGDGEADAGDGAGTGEAAAGMP